MKSICLREEIHLLAPLSVAFVNMIQNEVGKFSTCFIAPTFAEMSIYRILFCWSQLSSLPEAIRFMTFYARHLLSQSLVLGFGGFELKQG